MSKIRLLVVDDSKLMRLSLVRIFGEHPQIEIIGEACDGVEAVEQVKRLRPQCVTMDVQMPRMNGIEAVKAIMAELPTPVVMFSTITEEGARSTLEALSAGAVDWLQKVGGKEIDTIADELTSKIIAAAASKPKRIQSTPDLAPPRSSKLSRANILDGVVCVGSSTGGPQTLETVLASLPANLPAAVIVAQHMPAVFTRQLADNLDAACQLEVKEAIDGETLKPGFIYIAPGGSNTEIDGDCRISLRPPGPEGKIFTPSVDVLLRSAARSFGRRVLANILTGLGQAGSAALKDIKSRGGAVFAQDEDSCIVYGMPRAAAETGQVDNVLGLGSIASAVTAHWC